MAALEAGLFRVINEPKNHQQNKTTMNTKYNSPPSPRFGAVRLPATLARCRRRTMLPYRSKIGFVVVTMVFTAFLLISTFARAGIIPTFTVGDGSGAAGGSVTVLVSVQDFTDVTSAQFTLAWDPTVLQYQSTANVAWLPADFVPDSSFSGKLGCIWSPTGPQTLSGTIFTVTYGVSASAIPGNYTITFGDDPVLREVEVNFATATPGWNLGTVSISAVPEPVNAALAAFGFVALVGSAVRWRWVRRAC